MDTTVLKDKEKNSGELIERAMDKAISYDQYRKFVEVLAAEEKTTGPLQSASLINYTALNHRRMKRLDKTLKIDDAVADRIKQFSKKITWLVLTESWCGDAAQSLPMIHKVAALNQSISLKVALRDENRGLMDHFLTNGTLGIPKLIMIDDTTGQVLGDWGPRPSIATQMVADYKKEHGELTKEFKESLQLWYNKEKGQNVLDDLLQLLALE